MGIERGSEGRKAPSVREKLLHQFATFEEEGRAQVEHLSTVTRKFTEKNPSVSSKPLTEITDTAKAIGEHVSDEKWLTALKKHPGMTDQMMSEIFDARTVPRESEKSVKIEEGTDPSFLLEQALTSSDPVSEFGARISELRTLENAQSKRVKEEIDNFQAQDIPPDSKKAGERAVLIFGEYMETVANTVWLKAVSSHPYMSPQTLLEVCKSAEEIRNNLIGKAKEAAAEEE